MLVHQSFEELFMGEFPQPGAGDRSADAVGGLGLRLARERDPLVYPTRRPGDGSSSRVAMCPFYLASR